MSRSEILNIDNTTTAPTCGTPDCGNPTEKISPTRSDVGFFSICEPCRAQRRAARLAEAERTRLLVSDALLRAAQVAGWRVRVASNDGLTRRQVQLIDDGGWIWGHVTMSGGAPFTGVQVKWAGAVHGSVYNLPEDEAGYDAWAKKVIRNLGRKHATAAAVILRRERRRELARARERVIDEIKADHYELVTEEWDDEILHGSIGGAAAKVTTDDLGERIDIKLTGLSRVQLNKILNTLREDS